MRNSFSRRAIQSAVASIGLLIGLAGCQRINNSPPISLSPASMQVDEAMQARDWEPVSSKYANGSTVAGPIGFLYAPKSKQPPYTYALIDTPIFFTNLALMPYAFFQTPPWKPVQWKGDTVEPTYTAVPPLPPEPATP